MAEERVTELGALVETSGQGVRVTELGALAEVAPVGVYVTQLGALVEIEAITVVIAPYTAIAGNVHPIFDSFDLTPFIGNAVLDASVVLQDGSNFDSLGVERVPTLTAWSQDTDGHWSKELDDKLALACFHPPDAGKDFSVRIEIPQLGQAVTYAWTGAAYVRQYVVDLNNLHDAVRWKASFGLSGAPVRTVEAL